MSKDYKKLKNGVYLSPCGKNIIIFRNFNNFYEMESPKNLGRRISPARLFNYIYLGKL